MRNISRNLGIAAIALGMGASAALAAENLGGRWAATTVQGGVTIPFRLDISGDGNTVVGTLYNGEDKEFTTSGSIQDGKVELNFEHYLTSIVATVKDGELDGQIVSRRGGPAAEGVPNRRGGAPVAEGAPPARGGNTFHAKRYVAPTVAEAANAPSIDGVWEIPTESPKGEKAWRLIVKQKGAEITTTILRVDGDTGALTGGWQDGKFVASHFDGARPGLIVLTPQADGSLSVNLNAGQRTGILTAYRPEVARAKGLPEPSNYQTHTTVRDPNEVFTYSFPDTHGKILSNEDPKFKGKVVVAVVTGTWCPNCHDEAQYLVRTLRQVSRSGTGNRGTGLRRARTAEHIEARQRLHQAVQGSLPLPDCRSAGGYVGQGAAGGEPQYLAGHSVHRQGRQSEGDVLRVCRARQRDLSHAAQAGIHFHH